ncbi:hypothetical protein QBC42DRAFT_280595 [Cladorrhinum samala]|uniref:Uncharacterized protein n=1 Tax=Cladorrhinum samala TaxID=585594 RepID=A0AAV9H9Q1_9PEZI|nr:hypothetical protein QBC42DRAFT_280595 [Cladorrhinum samala]
MGLALYQFPTRDISSSSFLSSFEGEEGDPLESLASSSQGQDHHHHHHHHHHQFHIHDNHLYYHHDPSISGFRNIPISPIGTKRRRSRHPRNSVLGREDTTCLRPGHEHDGGQTAGRLSHTARDGRAPLLQSTAPGPDYSAERRRRPPSLERQDAFLDERTVKRRIIRRRNSLGGNKTWQWGREPEYFCDTENTSSQDSEEEDWDHTIVEMDHLLSSRRISGETTAGNDWGTMIDDILAPIIPAAADGIDSRRVARP